MKKRYRFMPLLLALMLLFCGCKSEKEVKKVMPSFSCSFPFSNVNTFASVTKNKVNVSISNSFKITALSLYETLKTDELKPIEKPELFDKKSIISLRFADLSGNIKSGKTPFFEINGDDVLIFNNGEKKQYFKALSGIYNEISGKADLIINESKNYYKERIDSGKIMISLLKADGSTQSEFEFIGKEILYKENLLLLRDYKNGSKYFYDREKSVLSGKVAEISDYFEGYVCSAYGKEIKLTSVIDKNFSYKNKNFEKEPADSNNPFVNLVFSDKNTVEISYYTKSKEIYSQKYDISLFYKDYEDKRVKAKAAALKPKAPESKKEYDYVKPSGSAEDGIPPFTAELEAKLMKLDNTRKGYGWKGSEERQGYYSNYNAYSTGDRSKNAVYLTFDEGYEYNNNTSKILDTLASKNVKAVFFVTMDFTKKHPELVKRMIDEGHTVGNHSTTHPVFPNISLQKCYDEISNLHNYILENFGYKMSLFRFPEGASSDRTLALVSEMGYSSVFWNCAYKDWDTSNQPSFDTTRKLVASNTQNGTIYLFHAVSNTNVSMLGEIIDTVRSSGYKFELFG